MLSHKTRRFNLSNRTEAVVSNRPLAAIGAASTRLGSRSCWAQLLYLLRSATGDILGNITDSSGSIVTGRPFGWRMWGTHEVRNFTTKGNGGVRFQLPAAGNVFADCGCAELQGCHHLEHRIAGLGPHPHRLSPAARSASETVEVSAVETSLQTDNTTVGSTITEKTLLDAPLNGRTTSAWSRCQGGCEWRVANLAAQRFVPG